MEQMIKELLEMVRNMTEQLLAMQEIIAAKDTQIAALTAKIGELTHKRTAATARHHRQPSVWKNLNPRVFGQKAAGSRADKPDTKAVE